VCAHICVLRIKTEKNERGFLLTVDSGERRDACRARLVARITVVDAYISIASSTSRRSTNSALSVHPPHPTAAPWVAAIHSALLYRSLRSSRGVTGDVNAPGEEDARAICMWLVIYLACVTRETARPVGVVDEFRGDSTQLRAFLGFKLARDAGCVASIYISRPTSRPRLRRCIAKQCLLEWRWCIPPHWRILCPPCRLNKSKCIFRFLPMYLSS